MKISVVVPVYNCEKYIENCISSVLNQTYTNLELILIDDGSTDKSGFICEEYSKKDTRVKVLHQLNSGASSARNKGIITATGEYIAFLDSDDYWRKKDFLQKVVDRLALYNPDVLNFNYCKVKDGIESPPYFILNEAVIQNECKKDSVDFICKNDIWIACAWNKIINRKLFQLYDMFFLEGVTAEDVEWSAKLALYAESFDYLDEVGVGYVQRINSVSGYITTEKIECLLENIYIVEKIANEIDKRKQELIRKYLSYQVAALYYDIASIEDRNIRKTFINKTKGLKKWLTYSTKNKVIFMNILSQIIGIKGMIFVLRIFVILNVRRN